jgi:hypothetical protein
VKKLPQIASSLLIVAAMALSAATATGQSKAQVGSKSKGTAAAATKAKAPTPAASSEIFPQRMGSAAPKEENFGLFWEYTSPSAPAPQREEKPGAAPSAVDTRPEKPPKGEARATGPAPTPALPPAGEAAAGGPKKNGQKPIYVKLDFSNVPLIDLIRSYSQLSGENFVFAGSIEGNANIIAKDKMSLEEARSLLEIALGMGGYTVLWGQPRGVNFNKIIKIETALGDGDVEVVGGDETDDSEENSTPP